MRRIRLTVPTLLTLLTCLTPRPVFAQEAQWMLMTDARVFAGFNDQQRKFTDITAWESQNWFMLDGMRHTERTRLHLKGMFSLEPFTMKHLGSPQVFQTGESYHGAPLIDYQHPHDLFMGLGASYEISRGPMGYTLEVDAVGSPALGPTAFMHRASARDNPQAPLSHHALDSTHVTPGVVRAEVSRGAIALDASVFTGREPDDNRTNIDRPDLDSWSARGTFTSGPWKAQVSGAHIHQPELFEPFDITRLTASAEFDGVQLKRPFAFTAAWGENREVHGIMDNYLLEWEWSILAHGSTYGRLEFTPKDILDLGTPSPPGFPDFHRISHVDALTIGYIHDVFNHGGHFGLGADATVYRISEDLQDSYGSPHSFHLFVRWRPSNSMSGMAMN
ncbi:MAG TPA: hypothetical protein VHZ73_11145 [Vicinamibacterales bacterium]|jgi:hypothetical protein|nr:hypothetical protein [Vicinamibacterales bacterium]